MSVDEIKTMVKRYLDEPWNQGKTEIIDEFCAPNFTVRYDTEQTTQGREEFKKAIREYLGHSPDLHAEINEILVDGDLVAYHWTMTVTNEQGKFVKTLGITLLRLENGKVVEDRFLAGELPQEEPVR